MPAVATRWPASPRPGAWAPDRPGNVVCVKLLYHCIAAFVGLSAAALIVFLVFGNASEQGAKPDSAAPDALASGAGGRCGSIAPAQANTPATRALAAKDGPALSLPTGPVQAIGDPTQRAWVARVHAASGLCTDEISFRAGGTVAISMSATKAVSYAEASALAAGTLAQAFTAPINPHAVTLTYTAAGTTRIATVGLRAWNAYGVRRRQLRVPLSMHTLVLFRSAVYRGQTDLKLVGWR